VALESIAWPAPPGVTDANDATQCYNMGRVFTLTADAPVVGVEWRVPDSVATPNGPHAIALWDVTSGTRLAYQEITPTPGGVEQFLFDVGDIHNGLTSEVLLAAVYMNHYCYNTSEMIGATSPSGTIVADEMLLIPFNGGAATAPIPDNATTLNFYVGPIINEGGDPPNEGSAALGLGLAVAATGARDSDGSAALGLGLGVAATGARDSDGSAALGFGLAVAATGSAPHGGSVAMTLNLALAGAGARDSLGSAALGFGLAVSGAGERDSSGSAALGLNLAVAVAGSNGDIGCPVPPYPFSPRAGITLPWTPRTVRSFPGGECT
jgi:hypothetical protein